MAIDTSSGKITATVLVGKRPRNAAIARDGAKLYVADGRSDSVSVIDTASDTKLRDIPAGKRPWGL